LRRSPGRGNATAMAGRPEVTWLGALPPAWTDANDRTPNRGGESSEGREPQESTDGRSQPGQAKRPSLNGLPGGAKLRSGRAGRQPASPVQVGRDTVRAGRRKAHRGDRASDRGDRRPGSCVRGPLSGGPMWQRAGAFGESGREVPAGTAPAAVGCEPARKQRPARAGTAPREGKALEGSSRDASGMKEGREASGATARVEVQKTSGEPRASQNRREGQEP